MNDCFVTRTREATKTRSDKVINSVVVSVRGRKQQHLAIFTGVESSIRNIRVETHDLQRELRNILEETHDLHEETQELQELIVSL
jgi:hypothetical protein